MKLDMSPRAISARLRKIGEISDLYKDHHLISKIDMSPSGISRRLRSVGSLTKICIRLTRHVPREK